MRSYCVQILTHRNITADYLKPIKTVELISIKTDIKEIFENEKFSSLGMVVHTYVVAVNTWEVEAKRSGIQASLTLHKKSSRPARAIQYFVSKQTNKVAKKKVK